MKKHDGKDGPMRGRWRRCRQRGRRGGELDIFSRASYHSCEGRNMIYGWF
jgi:hypothetical protein